MISAVEMLKQKGTGGKIKFSDTRLCAGDKKIVADSVDDSSMCRRVPFGLFGKAKEPRVAVDHVVRVFRGESVRGK